uniref:Acyl-coenzyme A oxidase n=1 Tax=Leptobrachium leishanense TaxID=445787 RepID=A0A8C5QLV2_9ANUR
AALRCDRLLLGVNANRDVNPELARERESPSFNVETLVTVLDGSLEETHLRRSVGELLHVIRDPVFSRENVHFKTGQERYEGAIERSFHLRNIMTQKGWATEGPEMSYVYRALSGELAFNVHGVFLKSVMALGTDEQIAKWASLASNYNIIGTYAQTELGHGTYLRGLETTATFDIKTQEFVINTPQITATKWWPGDLGKSCTHAVVLAQLITKDKSHGMHPFIVQIRSMKDHSPLPGITVGDIGPKMSFEHIDNGFLMLRSVRIPKENMLSRYSEVLPDGAYVKRGSDKINYFTMIAVRVSMLGNEVLASLKKACTISVRYSAVRRQSELKPGDQEAKIIDYQTQQQKLFPLVATCYAIHFTVKYGFVWFSYASEICSNGVEVCRKACGGHGYSLFSGLPSLYTKVVAACTYEGENTVLHLQTARFLVKSFLLAQSGKALPASTTYLSSPVSNRCRANNQSDFLNPDVYVEAYQQRAYRLVASAANKMHGLVQSGSEQYLAWNNTSVELVKAHTHYMTVKIFADALQYVSSEPEIQTAIKRVCDLYALHGVFTNAGDFLQDGYLSGKQLDLATAAYLHLLPLIRKDAVLLVDAFDFADAELLSAIGSYDGNVYHNLLEYAPSGCACRPRLDALYVCPFI